MSTSLRYLAARVINDVTDGRSLTERLDAILPSMTDARDRALVQAICYGVCRFYTRLDVILSFLLQKPMREKDSDVHALLLVGLYQLIYMRIPEYAAVTETVNATTKLKKSWARGFVNAVLREFMRKRSEIEEEIKTDIEAEYAHPQWWIAKLQKAWPKHWQAILSANNEHPPFAVRVNQQHQTREQYIQQLQAVEQSAQIIPETQYGLILENAVIAESLPGFFAGDVTIQDGAAQLASELLELTPHLRVLDACAAPGGKLTHLLEIEPTLEVIAIEKDADRMQSIKENLTRLKVQAQCICHDAMDVEDWWDGKLFDRILLDAPCSASGVIRRHPDIKLLREVTDIKALVKEQQHLLNALWPLLKPGGLFLYATCSVFPDENVNNLQQFLSAHPDAQEEKIHADWGLTCEVGRQILPGMHAMDGFYYARLRKM